MVKNFREDSGRDKRDIDIAASIYQDIVEKAAKTERRWRNSRRSGEPLSMTRSAICRVCFTRGSLLLPPGRHFSHYEDAGLVEVLRYLKEKLPSIERITTYARSKTAARKTLEELKQLHEAGLSRVHIGMESGHDEVLKFLDKGTTAEAHIRGGRNVVASGISLSEYIMPGAGGQKLWREHALETARVLNEINPDYIRLRTLTIQPRMELSASLADGSFVRGDDELVAAEIRLMLEKLDVTSTIASDHIINLLPEVEGKLPEDREKMLGVSTVSWLCLRRKDLYKLGRRLVV
jgi:hypothetical protein